MFGESSDSVELKNGEFEQRGYLEYYSVSLDHVFCFDHGGTRHAVVETYWTSCGGPCLTSGVVQLFAILAGHPVITQQFVFDSQAIGTGVTFDQKPIILTITGRSDDGSGHCCPKSLDVVTYHWQGTKFVRQDYKRVPVPEQ
jgi:hypothetical protein